MNDLPRLTAEVLCDFEQPPVYPLPIGQVWVWVGSAEPPHWEVRGTGALLDDMTKPRPERALSIPEIAQYIAEHYSGALRALGEAENMESNSNLVAHARHELELLGEDSDVIEWMTKVVAAYASFGHSGGSHSILIEQLYKLLSFENLTPLTSDPAEWEDRSEMSSFPIWQNKRNSKAFSEDAGITYRLIEERDDDTASTIYHSETPRTGE